MLPFFLPISIFHSDNKQLNDMKPYSSCVKNPSPNNPKFRVNERLQWPSPMTRPHVSHVMLLIPKLGRTHLTLKLLRHLVSVSHMAPEICVWDKALAADGTHMRVQSPMHSLVLAPVLRRHKALVAQGTLAVVAGRRCDGRNLRCLESR